MVYGKLEDLGNITDYKLLIKETEHIVSLKEKLLKKWNGIPETGIYVQTKILNYYGSKFEIKVH